MTENAILLRDILNITCSTEFREKAREIFRNKYPDVPEGVLADMVEDAIETWYEAYD